MPKHILYLCLGEREVKRMSPRTGRPVKGESPKSAQIGFRVRKDTVEKFEVCKTISGRRKVELFEEMVNDLYDKLTKK